MESSRVESRFGIEDHEGVESSRVRLNRVELRSRDGLSEIGLILVCYCLDDYHDRSGGFNYIQVNRRIEDQGLESRSGVKLGSRGMGDYGSKVAVDSYSGKGVLM